MKYLVQALVLASSIFLPFPVSTQAADCQFVLGFKTLHDLIPNVVGNCTADQHYEAQNGDALQETAHGLLVWRKADNLTAFTDGYRTWLNGPNGLQQRLNTERFSWESDGGRTTPTTLTPGPGPIPTLRPSLPELEALPDASDLPEDVVTN